MARRIAEGDHEGAGRQFVNEFAFGPGAWESLIPAFVREIMVQNAPTFHDELQDPEYFSVDEHTIRHLELPVRFTCGSESPPVFARTVNRLVELIPHATRETITGTAHVPQRTPEEYVQVIIRAAHQPRQHRR